MSANDDSNGGGIDIFGATLSRGTFTKGVGALAVGFSLVGAAVGAKSAKAAGTTPDATLPGSWLTIHPDNTIELMTGKVEMGQGSASTAFAMITAEELNVPYSAITNVIMGNTDQTPDGGISAGFLLGNPNVRVVAALTYQALLSLASTQLGVPVGSLSVTNGVVSGGGKQVSYGDLVKNQSLNLTIPVTGSLQSLFGLSVAAKPPTKPVDQYKIIGTSIPMRTIPPIVSGTATYVGDVRLPGMLHGRSVHPPTFGSTLVSAGTLDKKQFPNTQIVVKGNYVGVVDPVEYTAIQASTELARTTKWTTWSGLPASGNLFSAMRKLDWTAAPPATGAKTGNADAAIAGAATKLAATYEYPYEKHAPIGPTCAVGDCRADGTTYVHMHNQNPTATRWLISLMLGVPIDKVVVRWYDGSGHYGRGNGGSTGAEEEAVILSQAVGKPVRLQWMRNEDMQWSTQHPAAYSDVTAGLDANGKLVAFRANHYMPAMQDDRMVGALLAGMPTISGIGLVPSPGTFGSIANSASDPWVYDKVPNALQVAYGTYQLGNDPKSPTFNTDIGVRDHSMRTPAQRQQNFAQESAMSELAAAAKVDPIQFRLDNTSDPRVTNVLQVAKQESGWETRPSPNPKAQSGANLLGQGCSQMSREGAVWAAVAHVSVNPKTGRVKVLDITTVGDLGVLINPRQQQRMMEGGAIMGTSEALTEQVVFNTGMVTSRDWVTFPILRFKDAPTVKAIPISNKSVVASGGLFGMGGEGPNGYVQAAIANAVFDATGKQPRRLPLLPGYIKQLLAEK
jgi:nicotinate dehydrogenase subunit B